MIVEETIVQVYYVCDGCGARSKDRGVGGPETWAISQPQAAWGANAVKCRSCKTDCQRCDGTGVVFLPSREEQGGVARRTECPRCTEPRKTPNKESGPHPEPTPEAMREAYEVLRWMLTKCRDGGAAGLEADWDDGVHYAWTLSTEEPEGKPGWHTHCHIHEPGLHESIHALWQQTAKGEGLSRVASTTEEVVA